MIKFYYAVYTDYSGNFKHDDGSYYAVGIPRVSVKQAVRDGVVAKNTVPSIGGFTIHTLEYDSKAIFDMLKRAGRFNINEQTLVL